MSEPIDITDIVHRAVEQVKGKPFLEALMVLATMVEAPNIKKLRFQAEENRKKYVGINLFPKIYLNGMGRVIARQPNNPEESLVADMHSDASQAKDTYAQAIIEPVRRQIAADHHIRVGDLLPMFSNHRLIPPGRELIVARGLHSGLYGDLLVACHLLIPQLEESVRYVLWQSGVITSAFDDEGIQEEYNLNRMLTESTYADPLKKMFGENLIFDMRGLLVERFGANLRNELAHGLLNHDMFYSWVSYYCWWFALKFYSLPVLAALRNTEPTDTTKASET